MTVETVSNLLVAAWLLPVAGFTLVILFGRLFRDHEKPAWFTVLVMGTSFVLSAIALWQYMANGMEPYCDPWPWLAIGEGKFLEVGPYVDEVSVLLMAMVTLISTLVHIYSVGYMHGDPRKSRFMAYMQLFTFSMLTIVIANSLIQLFVGWELVGLTSYLLIGFWYEKRGPQLASKKAFVMNRIGDTGFLIGMGIVFFKFGGDLVLRSAEPGLGIFGTMAANGMNPLDLSSADQWWLTIAGIGLFCGAMGKSAQFPLHTWLPDAMEGPTPVSSIVHSATMVAAGVYLSARIFPILTPGAHLFISTIGLITLVLAAVIACAQTDIKRVLAYSTLSQLGYMILAVGVGAYTFALFHLITHAFFKCCLFQCSGSVIHACHHEQEMPKYGGLMRKMPLTAIAFAISTLAIAGAAIPYTEYALSGFYSKDGIIAGAINYGEAFGRNGMSWGSLFYWGPVIIAYVTPFYMMRAFVLTFLGKPRDKHIHDHAHEAPWTMWAPQLVLALFAIIIGWPMFRVGASIHATAPTMLTHDAAGQEHLTMMSQGFDAHTEMAHGFHLTHGFLLHGFAWIIPMVLAAVIYWNGFAITSRIFGLPVLKQLHWLVYNKFGFDGLYDTIFVALCKIVAKLAAWFDRMVVDGLVNLCGWLGKNIGFAVGGFDDQVVDGAVRGTGRSAVKLGGVFHFVQGGNLRVYVLILLAVGLAGLAVVVIPLALGWAEPAAASTAATATISALTQ
ncbi:MAG: NADH-quinone oxidoreductase subunit L [Planctomycetes bacterium]|nr:NADH-quinone oxidoreductase subunit L [Planctomycetota bacterium]NOG54298.1 NADH-quinone oxidoreductase subunit L [Planctomycetota bacterium]